MKTIKCTKCGAFARREHPPEIDRRNKKDKPLCRCCVLENDAKRASAEFWQRHDRRERIWYGYSMPARRDTESRAYRERLRDVFGLLRGEYRQPSALDFSGGFNMRHQMIVIDDPINSSARPNADARREAYEWFTRELPDLVRKEVEIPAEPFDPARWYNEGKAPEDVIPYLSPWSPDSEPDK